VSVPASREFLPAVCGWCGTTIARAGETLTSCARCSAHEPVPVGVLVDGADDYNRATFLVHADFGLRFKLTQRFGRVEARAIEVKHPGDLTGLQALLVGVPAGHRPIPEHALNAISQAREQGIEVWLFEVESS
jgi:hypothetical protein